MDERVAEMRAEKDSLRDEVARLHGEIDALRERFSALDAAVIAALGRRARKHLAQPDPD